MTVINQPYGWQPETTDATVYTTTAYSRGDLVFLLSKFSLTTDETYGVPGFSRAYSPNTSRSNQEGTVYGIALEDVAAGKYFRVRIRGRCEALVEKDASNITQNTTLVPGKDETTDANAMMHAADLNASSSTVAPSARKILAIAEESHTSVTAGLIKVLFNGAEGFGTELGPTPA